MKDYEQSEMRLLVEKIKNPSIIVVGDIMLDKYSWGDAKRISPEAPIPVLSILSENHRLGGAGNVMMNLVTLGAKVFACGIVGNDESGKIILNLLEKNNIKTNGVEILLDYPSVVKHRMISGHTHLLRIDHDPPSDIKVPQKKIISFLKNTISDVDAIIVSDYGKGLLKNSLLEEIASIGKTFKKPVVGDPRRKTNFKIYNNFSIIKPNRKETEFAVGFSLNNERNILEAANIIKNDVDLDYLVISLDKLGMLLYQNNKNYKFLKIETKEVFDVVGAGDMLISVMTFFIAAKLPIEIASFWAQLAAGMTIQHVGVVSFTLSELIHRFDFGEKYEKIVSLDQLNKYLKEKKDKVVFTNGFFDNISASHLKFLQQMKNLNGFNIVALNSDRVISLKKGSPPLLNERERALLLSSIDNVDRVIIFDEENASNLITTIKPSIVVKGERYSKKTLPEVEAINKVGAEVKYFKEY